MTNKEYLHNSLGGACAGSPSALRGLDYDFLAYLADVTDNVVDSLNTAVRDAIDRVKESSQPATAETETENSGNS